jgi:pyruvate/2-oxoglutarate dehydrogenase complex dihydrolipoamide dehydrogenase (E3) component
MSEDADPPPPPIQEFPEVIEFMPEHSRPIDCDICVIGGGSAGLSVAAGAAQMGANVVLIERDALGGDCLNTGCVPSKSLIAAARVAHTAQIGKCMGIGFPNPDIDFVRVHDHVHSVIAAISPHDSVERFESLGIRVMREHATFCGRGEVVAGKNHFRARRFVIATGSRAALPAVKGLAEAEPLTNETIFELTERPEHLIVVGGGPIGLEMAQAFRRLGAVVTVIERFGILPRDEPEAAALAREVLGPEGITLHENAGISEVRRDGRTVTVSFVAAGDEKSVSGSHILVAAGRIPNTDGMGLAEAGVRFGAHGIEVDARLRTSNRKIFALGDVAGGPQFTHIAAYHAGVVIRNALFGLPAKVDYRALPWVTYLDPEIAHVGLTEGEARKKHRHIQTVFQSFDGNDRAQAERRTEGFIKLILGRRGKVLGATIAGPHAGELIGVWALVISRGLPLSAVAGMIAPYPTLSEISKRAASAYFTPQLFGDRVQWLVRLVQRWLP